MIAVPLKLLCKDSGRLSFDSCWISPLSYIVLVKPVSGVEIPCFTSGWTDFLSRNTPVMRNEASLNAHAHFIDLLSFEASND